jgi:hypothetical protein
VDVRPGEKDAPKPRRNCSSAGRAARRRGEDDERLKRWRSCCCRPWLRATENGGGPGWDVRRPGEVADGHVTVAAEAARGAEVTGAWEDRARLQVSYFSSSLGADAGMRRKIFVCQTMFAKVIAKCTYISH